VLLAPAARLTILISIGVFSLLAQSQQQTSTRSSREVLIQQIENLATDHAAVPGTPMKDDSAVALFRGRGLADEEISEIYRRKFLAVRAKTKPWWERYWWLAWLAALVLVFAKAFKGWLEERAKKLYEALYQRYAGAKVFRGQALRRYRESIIRQHRTLKIPFRDSGLAMSEVYVPLKFSGAESIPVEAFEAIRQFPKLMVKGNPGSGKSMLLRAVLLAHAEGRLTGIENEAIPVLIELSRLNGVGHTLQQQISAAFDRYGFPNAGSFVDWSLEHRALLLLLDGLDEVNTQ
jgi:hypothetical protein